MHISYESGILEKPECPAPDHIYQMTSNPEDWPNKADLLTIDFVKGFLFGILFYYLKNYCIVRLYFF